LANSDNSDIEGLNLFLLLTVICTETPHRQGKNFVYERDLCNISLTKLPALSQAVTNVNHIKILFFTIHLKLIVMMLAKHIC
jgi:hypothetical protein